MPDSYSLPSASAALYERVRHVIPAMEWPGSSATDGKRTCHWASAFAKEKAALRAGRRASGWAVAYCFPFETKGGIAMPYFLRAGRTERAARAR